MIITAESGANGVPTIDGNALATAIMVPGNSSDMGLVVADMSGSVVGGSIVFSFNPHANEFQTITICGASGAGSLSITTAEGTRVMDGVVMTGSSSCTVVDVQATNVTTLSVSTNGIVSSIAVCTEPDDDYNAPPTACPPSEPELLGSIESPNPELPIKIISQDTTSVTFQVINTFNETTTVFTQYHTGNFGEVECLEVTNVNVTEIADTYTAQCMHNVPITILNIWVASTVESGSVIIDNDEVPGCCLPDQWTKTPTVQYTLKIPCVDPCPVDEPSRHLSKVEISKSLHDYVTQEEAKGDFAPEPSGGGEDEHFCVSVDYPCGETGDQVYVCHYSARDGYKTFCVPEPDSDVLAFYPKDYCGPCVGGYATK
jgi:hypothetical protein